jgi:hypothetical protein
LAEKVALAWENAVPPARFRPEPNGSKRPVSCSFPVWSMLSVIDEVLPHDLLETRE